MYLNRKLGQETEDDESLTKADEKTRVYICTTMYREVACLNNRKFTMLNKTVTGNYNFSLY